MKTAGVIAEYNPFHNGHKYQLDEIRKRTNADYIIVIMSGDFVQRGEPAILDKYTRASMALSCGADLVLELPCLYAVSSAELFARGGVQSLAAAGCVDYLCFGAESDSCDLLSSIAGILAAEPAEYRDALQACLKQGKPYPEARETALLHVLSYHMSDCSERLHELLNQPNNILAIEYLKQLHILAASNENKQPLFPMEPVLIPRSGDGYHDKTPNSNYASATAIRNMLAESYMPAAVMTAECDLPAAVMTAECDLPAAALNHSAVPDIFENMIKKYVPEAVLSSLFAAKMDHRLIFPDSLTYPLGYRLSMLSADPSRGSVPAFADCSPELLNRMLHFSSDYEGYDPFNGMIKNKSITWSHVRRAMLHILLNYEENMRSFYMNGEVPYLRVLGFRREAAGLLGQMKEKASVPVITKPAEEMKQLTGMASKAASFDLSASDFYNTLIRMQGGSRIKNDYSHPMVIL